MTPRLAGEIILVSLIAFLRLTIRLLTVYSTSDYLSLIALVMTYKGLFSKLLMRLWHTVIAKVVQLSRESNLGP